MHRLLSKTQKTSRHRLLSVNIIYFKVYINFFLLKNMRRLYVGIDIQKILDKISGLPRTKYPSEKHLFNHSFAGPGTWLDLRLNSDDTPITKPINRVNAAAYKHDLAYRDNADLESRHLADLQMIEELANILNPTFREEEGRAIVVKLLWAKLKLAMGYADGLHHEFWKPEHLLKVKVFKKDDIWLADLIELREGSKFKYILTVIDLYMAVPLPNKTDQTVSEAFKRIMNESGRKPKKVWVDKGKEFYNQYVKTLLFEIYSTLNDGKAVVIEQFNHTLKQMTFKKFTSQGNQKWLKILPEIADKYKNKVHSTIQTTPIRASENPNYIGGIVLKNNIENELTLPQNLNSRLVNACEFSSGNRSLQKDTQQSGSKKSL